MTGLPRVPFLDLAAINARFQDDFAAAFSRVAAHGQWVLGPELEAFEGEFAAYCGCKHAIGVGNGLEALELVLRAWGIGPGDEVIVPTNTFIATWLAVSLVGATPVGVDAEIATHTLGARGVAEALTERTRAVIPVHLYGRPAPMDELRALASAHGVKLLEDAAQGHGAMSGGRRAGALGDAAAFSFYPAKNLGALGDGGAITTDDTALARELRLLRNYGSSRRYIHDRIGRNSRLDELQAAFLRIKLKQLDADNRRRADIARRYNAGLKGSPGLLLPLEDSASCGSAWHLYVVRHARRDALMERLTEAGVETLIHYPLRPDLQAAYRGVSAEDDASESPVSARLHREVLSLPIGPTMQDDAVDRVIKALKAATTSLL